MRRLRENAMLEPQINKTGEVIVEGHVIGRLDGFVFIAEASSGGSDAKALHNAAQKALAGEIATRAVRLGGAPDGQFVLASDGTIRWTGAAVGKIVAGEDALRPRVRVVADEQLTGAPRETVQARLELWLKSHLEKLLGPLFDLAAANDVTGMARGIAFQLIEALGVLERQRVADEVKGLEQPARAMLRKYGVRFGAYHIYIPALLKPAPRALAAQLWALAHDGPQTNGLDDLLSLAGSGRTSIPANREIDAVRYRAAGYRVCGERAVRVDILERLADLIRPALAWREGGAGPKPPGAIAGGGFTIVNGMTSLIGASGEDFSSILRSLGYHMERRPRPAEPPATTPGSAPAVSDVVAGSATCDPTVPDVEAPDAKTPDAETLDVTTPAESPAASPAIEQSDAAADAPRIESADEQAPYEAVLQPMADALTMSTLADTATPSTADVATPAGESANAVAEEAALIEVWRPGRAGRTEGRRRSRFRHHDGKKDGKHGVGEAPTSLPTAVAADAPAPAAAPGSAAQPAAGEGAAAAPTRQGRPQRHRGRDAGEHRSERPQRDRERRPANAARFERRDREKAPDPNSPFAKLAALKAQLEADAKERH
jgi:ATP-dependent RNA helicase SUPV3L1/SUV3